MPPVCRVADVLPVCSDAGDSRQAGAVDPSCGDPSAVQAGPVWVVTSMNGAEICQECDQSVMAKSATAAATVPRRVVVGDYDVSVPDDIASQMCAAHAQAKLATRLSSHSERLVWRAHCTGYPTPQALAEMLDVPLVIVALTIRRGNDHGWPNHWLGHAMNRIATGALPQFKLGDPGSSPR